MNLKYILVCKKTLRLSINLPECAERTLECAERMLRLDYTTYAETSDCLVFFCLNSIHHSPCTIRSGDLSVASHVQYDLAASTVVLCTISISEPHILRYLVLGESRSLSP